MRLRLLLLAAAASAATLSPAEAGPFDVTVTGRVTQAGGAGIEDVCVRAVPQRIGSHAMVESGSDGAFELTVEAGLYKFSFADCAPFRAHPFASEWYDGQPSEGEAGIVVAATDITGLDAELDRAGVISGRVTDQFGRPAAWMCVARVQGGYAYLSSSTDADGRYRFFTEGDALYTIRFGGCAYEQVFEPEWFDDVQTLDEAVYLAAPPGTETVADAVVVRTGSIKGTVTDAETGGAIWSMCAIVTRPDGTFVNENEIGIDLAGAYEVGGLGSGSYLVRFADCHRAGWAGEWYDDSQSRDGATPVVVTDGYATDGVDAVLDRAGHITGRVTEPDGDPARLCVWAWNTDMTPSVSTSTDENGRYRLPYVQPRVKVSFGHCDGFMYEWYDDASTVEAATVIEVPPATTVTGIDAVVEPQPGPAPCEGYEWDIDGDRLTDCEEFVVYGTNAYQPDTDDDLFGDGFEVKGGTCGVYTYGGGSDPKDGASTPVADLPAGAPRRTLPYDYLLVACR